MLIVRGRQGVENGGLVPGEVGDGMWLSTDERADHVIGLRQAAIPDHSERILQMGGEPVWQPDVLERRSGCLLAHVHKRHCLSHGGADGSRSIVVGDCLGASEHAGAPGVTFSRHNRGHIAGVDHRHLAVGGGGGGGEACRIVSADANRLEINQFARSTTADRPAAVRCSSTRTIQILTGQRRAWAGSES